MIVCEESHELHEFLCVGAKTHSYWLYVLIMSCTRFRVNPHLHSSLAKWLSVCLWTKWLWVRVQLQSLILVVWSYLKTKIFEIWKKKKNNNNKMVDILHVIGHHCALCSSKHLGLACAWILLLIFKVH